MAASFGVSWHTPMAAVRDHGQPLVEDPVRTQHTKALGLDEAVWSHTGPRRRTEYVTGFVDLDRAQLLDVVPGRSGTTVHDWLGDRPRSWLAQIEVAALDPFRSYATGLRAHLVRDTIVLDHFHAIALANSAINDVWRRTQQTTLEVGATWVAKELLCEIYTASDARHARRRFVVFHQNCAEAEAPELTRLAKTISSWEHEVLAYHDAGLSNGPTEAVNLLIEKARRIGHGYGNFDNYRLGLLLTCHTKWHTAPVARIRAHQPNYSSSRKA